MYIAIVSGNNESVEELTQELVELTQENINLNDKVKKLTQEVERLNSLRGELANYTLVELMREAIKEFETNPSVRFTAYQEYLVERGDYFREPCFVAPDQNNHVIIYDSPDPRGGNYGREWAEYERREGLTLDPEEKVKWVRAFREWYQRKKELRNNLIKQRNGTKRGFSEDALKEAENAVKKAQEKAKETEEALPFDAQAYHEANRKVKAKRKVYEDLKKKGELISVLRQDIRALNRQIGES